jgi:molybdopterin molybdotransferase
MEYIPFEEALRIVLGEAVSLPSEETAMEESLGRILAEDIFSDVDMPPFDKSAVDGFAIRMEDLAYDLEIIETIPAGKKPEKKIGPRQCSRIMTGGMLPEGANGVLMVEDTEVTGTERIRFTKDKSGVNICFRGEDVRAGDKVLEKGTLLHDRHLAVLASVGATRIRVGSRPRTGILSTGDELVEPDRKPDGPFIRNSNAAQLIAQVREAGCIPSYFGIAPDEPGMLEEMIRKATGETGLLLVSGGVSMGELDFVPAILRQLGYDILVHGISIQPGRPTIFAKKENRFIFGLPGNPVSSFVLFEVLVKPFLRKMMGGIPDDPRIRLPLGADFLRRKSNRKAFIPVRIREGEIFPVDYHGSAHIHAYASADGIIAMETGVSKLRKGEWVYVRPI